MEKCHFAAIYRDPNQTISHEEVEKEHSRITQTNFLKLKELK